MSDKVRGVGPTKGRLSPVLPLSPAVNRSKLSGPPETAKSARSSPYDAVERALSSETQISDPSRSAKTLDQALANSEHLIQCQVPDHLLAQQAPQFLVLVHGIFEVA